MTQELGHVPQSDLSTLFPEHLFNVPLKFFLCMFMSPVPYCTSANFTKTNLFIMAFFFFYFWATPGDIQRSLLALHSGSILDGDHMGPYGILGTEPGSATYMANVLLSLWPPSWLYPP